MLIIKDLFIKDLFIKILLYVKKKRNNNKNYDGLKFWRSIKPILNNSKFKAKKWKKMEKKYYNNIMKLPEFYINGFGKKEIIAENHFIIQTVRIPVIEKPSLRKIMQIALNIGQYLGHNNTNTLKKNKIKDYVDNMTMNTKLINVLEESDIKKILKKLK